MIQSFLWALGEFNYKAKSMIDSPFMPIQQIVVHPKVYERLQVFSEKRAKDVGAKYIQGTSILCYGIEVVEGE